MADRSLEHVLVEVATGLWRLQRRLGAGTPEARQVRRIFDVLGDADIRVDDHHGVTFDPGLAIDVVAYQPTEGVTREQVIETLVHTLLADDPSAFVEPWPPLRVF